MIEKLKSPAPHVVAAKVSGKVTKQDVSDYIKLIEDCLDESRRINLYFDLTELEGFSATALLNDLAYALKNLGRTYRFQQMAIITDNPTMVKAVEWEDWLFKTIEIQRFSGTQRDQALSWIERRVELPVAGFESFDRGGHLELRVAKEVTGHDILSLYELIHQKYEQSGPIRMLAVFQEMPKIGPGLVYEKLKQMRILNLISRYAVVGPDSLKTRVKAMSPLIQAEIRHFSPQELERAEEWIKDQTPSTQVLPTWRDDRFAIRLSGKITHVEIASFYEALLPHLRGDNSLDVLLEIPYQDGITLKALFQAIKLGLKHYQDVSKGVRRLALITDSRFLTKATEIENILWSGVEERPFTFQQRAVATAWLDEGRPESTRLLTAGSDSDEP